MTIIQLKKPVTDDDITALEQSLGRALARAAAQPRGPYTALETNAPFDEVVEAFTGRTDVFDVVRADGERWVNPDFVAPVPL